MTTQATYTKEQLEHMGFRTEDGWAFEIEGDWVVTDENQGGGTIDLTVDYVFHFTPDEDGTYPIDNRQYAFSATVKSIDFWNGDGPPPFQVGETFDTLDEVTFSDCTDLL